MQTTLLGLAIALILALLAALVGPYFVNWNDHRAFFEAEASRIVGLKVSVSGNIDAAILPVPSVTLRDIAIGPAGEASRLRARSLRIDLSLGPLFRGELRAVEMRLVAPQFSVGLDNKGQIDWPPLALGNETLSIDRLRIEDGRATLTDATGGSRLVLDQLWFAGEMRSLTGPFRGKGEFVAGGQLYGYDVSAGRYGPDGTRLKLGLKTDEHPLTIEADGMLAFERAAPRFDGVLTLARPAGAVLARGKAMAYEPWRLTGKIKADASTAALEEVSFQYGPDERAVTLAGSAEFKFGAQPQLQGNLSARQVDLDRLLVAPDGPRRLPFPAVQAFGELLAGALRPSWPVQLSIGVDSATLGGATLQNIASELRSDGRTWNLDKLELRAPGFSQIKLHGGLYPVGKGLGFAGGASIDSNDPKNLVAWLTGRAATAAQIKPWHAKGDVTLGADRIAVERLQTEFERGAVEGSVAYAWPAGNRPARLEADLRAAELDLDAAFGLGQSALPGLGLEWPREVKLALDIGRGRIAGFEARNAAVRLTYDASGLAIERLSIADFGDTSIEASGRIQTGASPGGNVTVDLAARDLGGIIALSDQFAPSLAAPLRRLASRHKMAMLHATVSLGGSGSDSGQANARLGLTGQVGAIRVNVSANATGKREAFTVTNLGALVDTDVRLDGQFQTDEAAALLALLGLDRIAVSDKRPARLSLTANGPLNGDLRFDGKLDAGPIDVGGKGVIRLPSDQPAAVNLDQFAGTIGGNKVQGRLVFRFGETARVDGSIDTETLDAPATIAAAIGMPVQGAMSEAAPSWSTEPFAWSASGLTGRVEFKAQRAAFSPAVAAQGLHGVARFSPAEIVFEDVAGELAKGRLEGRLAFKNGSDGLSARVNVDLSNAEAGAFFAGADRPALAGRLALQSELEGVGRSPAAFIGSLAGYGTVTLEHAKLAGLNPGVFDAVTRAVELGIPTDGNRIRDFVSGVLDSADLPVSRATASISVNAGQARLRDIVIRAAGADLEATASVDLAAATLESLLTLTAPPAAPGAVRPVVLVALKGPLQNPKRTIDTSLLTSWLTLRAVEQHSKQIDAIERSGRELGPPKSPAPAPAESENNRPSTAPLPNTREATPPPPGISPNTTGGLPANGQAPALPPPVNVPAAPKPHAPPRADNAVPLRAIVRPPGLIGAQN